MSEIVFLESEDVIAMEEDPVQENPQEPLYFIPLSKGRGNLTTKQRLFLLRQELEELEQDVESESNPEASQVSHSYISEISSIARYAEDLLRGQGIEVEGDLGIESNLTRNLGKALLGVLPESENMTYILNSSLPEEVCEVADRQIASIAALASRISRLEDTLGVWNADNGYYNIQQALGQIKKNNSNLNNKKIENINKQAEDLNGELDMIKEQLLTLQSSCVELKAVDSMYPLVDICEEVAPVLPEIIERFEVIKRVHDEGSRFNERVNEIKERQARIEEKLKSLDLNQLNAQWDLFKTDIENEFKLVESMISHN